MSRKKKVAYFYDSEFATFYFGQNHPMKPHRLAMTHQLVLGYGLHKKMDVYRPRKAYPSELSQFHSEEYIEFLSKISMSNQEEHQHQLKQYNLREDCPVFEGMFDFCRLYAGASVEGAVKLNHGLCDIAINWAGGLHHAKKSEASGFCYVNDLVLACLELLKYHARVLYIDIDVHHGDGVEEAFYLCDRVMTVSFHKYGDYFFPGTGDIKDVGEYNGRYYSLNVPLKDGTTDDTFLALFKPIMDKVIQVFQPGAIVMQCGADSLAHDRLGCFNLSLHGHAEALRHVKKFGIPMLVTGGGGYTKHNVARCWTYETALLLDENVPEQLPKTEYHDYFAPDYSLNVHAHRVADNCNTKQEIERIRNEILANLSKLEGAPGVAFHEVPSDTHLMQYCLDDDTDERLGHYAREHMIIKENEHMDDDHDGEHWRGTGI